MASLPIITNNNSNSFKEMSRQSPMSLNSFGLRANVETSKLQKSTDGTLIKNNNMLGDVDKGFIKENILLEKILSSLQNEDAAISKLASKSRSGQSDDEDFDFSGKMPRLNSRIRGRNARGRARIRGRGRISRLSRSLAKPMRSISKIASNSIKISSRNISSVKQSVTNRLLGKPTPAPKPTPTPRPVPTPAPKPPAATAPPPKPPAATPASTSAVKTLDKAGIKSLIKTKLAKISGKVLPGIGLIFGAYEVIERIGKGDYVGSSIGVASGVAGLLPGIGTGISVVGSAVNISRDLYKEIYGMYPEQDNSGNVKQNFKDLVDMVIEEMTGKKLSSEQAKDELLEIVRKYKDSITKQYPQQVRQGIASSLRKAALKAGISKEQVDKELGEARGAALVEIQKREDATTLEMSNIENALKLSPQSTSQTAPGTPSTQQQPTATTPSNATPTTQAPSTSAPGISAPSTSAPANPTPPQPGQDATKVNSASPTGDVEQILATIRKKESSNNYTAQSGGSSASGAYQFIDSTWSSLAKRYGIGTEFKSAKDAPKEIQDAVAAAYVRQILRDNAGDVSKVPLVWYTGNAQGKMSDAAIAANRGQTGEDYKNKWMAMYSGNGQQLAQSSTTKVQEDRANNQRVTNNFNVAQAAPTQNRIPQQPQQQPSQDTSIKNRILDIFNLNRVAA